MRNSKNLAKNADPLPHSTPFFTRKSPSGTFKIFKQITPFQQTLLSFSTKNDEAAQYICRFNFRVAQQDPFIGISLTDFFDSGVISHFFNYFSTNVGFILKNTNEKSVSNHHQTAGNAFFFAKY